MMAQQIIYSKNRLKKEFPNHFEIIKEVSNIDDKMMSRLYNDPSLTAEKFIASAKKHYPDLQDSDRIYFYTNQFKPALITDDDF